MNFSVLTVTLNPAVDKLVKVKKFLPGQDHRVCAIFRSAGGKGINVARALIHLGVSACATGFIGGPSGFFIRDVLQHEKIPADFLNLSGETRTSLTVLDQSSQQLTRILEPGPILSRRQQREFLLKYSTLAKKVRFVVLSGRNAYGMADNYYAHLIRIASRLKRKVILDTSGPAFVKGVSARPFIIKPNLEEAEYFLARRLSRLADLKKALSLFLKKGISIPIISLGHRGAVASDGSQFLFAQAPKIRACNPVGCGDALVAGFVFCLLKGYPFSRALQTAVAAGTVNALNEHPGLIKQKRVRHFIPEVRIKSL